MCGIVGYVGKRAAEPVILNALKALEYRGYDSSGIAVANGNAIEILKDAIRVEELKNKAPVLSGTIGVGHTRWATHGVPSAANAHPHIDCSGKIAVVHNGVITNYQRLRYQLEYEGHHFTSETDTEIIPHLIEKYYIDSLEKAVEAALSEVRGSYAIIVMMEGKHKLIGARKDSPLVIGVGDGESLIASDTTAVLDYTNRVIYLEDDDICVVDADNIEVTNNKIDVIREEKRISWNRKDLQKNGYEHFMHKEIHEQGEVIRNQLREYLQPTERVTDFGSILDGNIEDLTILACGTSYHAGLVGKYIIEELVGIPVRVELASEFNHCRRTLPSSKALVVTQSGETADVLIAMKRLRHMGIETIAITNVPDSSVSRATNQSLLTMAGPEIGVAATKTFIAQLILLYEMVLSHSDLNPRIRQHMLVELSQLADKAQQVLDNEAHILDCAKFLSQYDHTFFIGRGVNLPIALEGALKLKEISYMNAGGYAAGELKHGPFALLNSKVPTIAIVARDNTHTAMLTNIREVKSRSSPVIAIADETDDIIDELSDLVIRVPCVDTIFTPVVNTIALQLLAYHTARCKGCSIDYPRNLAKSVTVE